MSESYVGRLAFVERVEGSNYNNGEYFIVQQTQHTLYGVRLVGGYGGHELHKFALIGKEACAVVSSYQDDAAVKIALVRMKQFADAPSRKEKLQWCESVYTGVESNIRLVERTLAVPEPATTQEIATIFGDGSRIWIEMVKK